MQLGWLHASPAVKQDKPGGKGGDNTPSPSRYEKFTNEGIDIKMPDVGEFGYLINYWQSAGMVSTGGMGPIPLTAVDLNAWIGGTKRNISAVDFQIILDLSKEYLSYYRKSEQPGYPPAYGDINDYVNRESVGKNISNVLKSRIKKPQK